MTFSCEEPTQKVRKPNFVFILVDDLGWKDIGCFGSTFYETPNVDQLAATGMRFTDAYAACPVCSPTRASIMTGKYPARIRVTDWIPGRQARKFIEPHAVLSSRPFELQVALEEETIAEALKEANYTTFFAGKWHLGEDSLYWPENQGFDINKGGHSKGSPPGGYFSPYTNPRLESGPKGEYLTDRLGDESVEFLESVGENPFLLYLSFYTVHNPMQGKESLIAKYQGKSDALGNTKEDRFVYDKPWMSKAAQKGNWRERMVQDLPVYASMVESMDTNVGRVLDKLKELGMEENTVVIFMSDNGGLATSEGSPTTNLPLRAGKGWLYEGGIREPMIIRWPGKTAPGSVSQTPVTSTDFYPTMLEMAGLPMKPEQHQDGVSLVPLLTKAATIERDIFWHYPHYSNQGDRPGGAIRSGNYKLIERFETGQLELFDLENDLGETKDLAEEMPEKVQELHQKLLAWRKSVNAEMMDENPEYDPEYVRVRD
ncbi:UNVERIFIED_CONTAM: hypothetical protein GTU68_008792 [Idotea baltica]|nr:hypothetical protein [Idotea baltica]